MTTQTSPRESLARTIGGGVAAATIGLIGGVALAEVSHLMRWSKAVPYTIVGIVALWLALIGADRLVRRVRRVR